MRFKKGTPGEGACPRAEQFRYTKTQPGFKGHWYGWCAAEPYWCRVHEHTDATPGTKVCLHWFTDGGLSCPRCRPDKPATCVCYVHLWREDDRAPCLVIVHESAADLMVGVKFGTYCMVACIEKGSSVFVRPADEQRRWQSDLPNRQGPVDIAVSLLTVWKYPALEAWLKLPQRKGGTAPAEAPTPPRLRLSVPPPTSTVEALAVDAERKAPSAWQELVDDTLNRAVKRGDKPSKNGNAHHGESGGSTG